MVESPRRLADVVVLAAGRSSRMGEPKGLVAFEGRPWLLTQLAALEGRRVVLVLAQDGPRYHEAIPGLAQRVDVVANPEPERGPFSSLQVGLERAGQRAPRDDGNPVFVLPIDVPAPSATVWTALEEALSSGGHELDAAVPVFDGRGGHPVLLAPHFQARLLGRDPASPEARLDAMLRSAHARHVPVADPRVRLNLNAPEDWGKLVKGT
jgi:CTP:molybdopterin cytidylyltransferase MocA